MSTGPAQGEFSCAIMTDGSLYCWGNNQFGQIGHRVAPGLGVLKKGRDIVKQDARLGKVRDVANVGVYQEAPPTLDPDSHMVGAERVLGRSGIIGNQTP